MPNKKAGSFVFKSGGGGQTHQKILKKKIKNRKGTFQNPENLNPWGGGGGGGYSF